MNKNKFLTQLIFIWLILTILISAKEKVINKNIFVPITVDNSIMIFISTLKIENDITIVNIKLQALTKIKLYAKNNDNSVPSVGDYVNATIVGVNDNNIIQINEAIAQKSATEVNSVMKIQVIIDNENKNIIKDKILVYAEDNNNTSPTVEDYKILGMRCIDNYNISHINNIIANNSNIQYISDIQKVVNKENGMKSIILDNDAFDPDWVIMLTTTLGLEENCESHISGIVLTGRDMNRKQGMLYSSILYHYNRQDIPLGLNSKQIMREYSLDATRENIHHINYEGIANDIDDFKSDQCVDYEWCWGRNESTNMLCTILENTTEKVTWVIGGHLHNIANLLKETELCNGKELISEKVKEIVLSTGWSDRINGNPEMNLSEGTKKSNSANIATKYLFANRPQNVPIIIASIPGTNTSASRVGDIYLDKKYHNSPMAYILSVPRYGIYGDHGLSDTEALLYAAREGVSSNGVKYVKKIKTCFHINNYGAVTIGNNCIKEDYYLEKSIDEYTNILEYEVRELMDINIQ